MHSKRSFRINKVTVPSESCAPADNRRGWDIPEGGRSTSLVARTAARCTLWGTMASGSVDGEEGGRKELMLGFWGESGGGAGEGGKAAA